MADSPARNRKDCVTFMKRLLLAAAIVAASSLSAHAAIVDMTLIQRISLVGFTGVGENPSAGVNSNPAAVAWDGTNAYVAGFNNSTSAALNLNIARIANAVTAPTTSLTSTYFGTLSTVASRGFTSLTVDANNVYASYDNGVGTSNAVRAFNKTTGASVWSLTDTGRRGGGTAIDPGFQGGASTGQLGFVGLGMNRRAVVDKATGAYVTGYTNTDGMLIPPANNVNNWRDITFDSAGNIYGRENNRVLRGLRTGDNQVNNSGTSIYTDFSGSLGSTIGQNIDFVDSTQYGGFLVMNDRPNGNATPFTTAVRAIDLAGSFHTLNFNFGTFGTIGSGVRHYDFSFDKNTQTLAMSDFGNKSLYIFRVGAAVTAPETGTVSLLALGAASLVGVVLRKRKAA